jgi:hypothetical protein
MENDQEDRIRRRVGRERGGIEGNAGRRRVDRALKGNGNG